MSVFILSLSDPRADLERVGGKGMSLAKLSRSGISVPDGFHITTDAYRDFVAANGIQPGILAALDSLDFTTPAAVDAASAAITRLFLDAPIPGPLLSEIADAYSGLCGPSPRVAPASAVAVRSSATAEDLPEASFAGQQETYLNVCGTDEVLSAVRKCWASLWTSRAIAYRARQGISPDSVALAVVVQHLIPADASGVIFTANPVSGERQELMITAAWGLGEAIVSGAVTPDTLTLEKGTGRIIRREIAAKLRMTVRTVTGVRETPVPRARRKRAVLSGTQARDLSVLGCRIEQLYGRPMDIEWSLAGGKLSILQARPVTALPSPVSAAPEEALQWPVPHPKAVLARGSFAEFVPEPVSPLFATLAVPIARKASVRLMSEFGLGDPNSYLFTVLNDYIYVGFIFTPVFIWKMLAATLKLTGMVVKTARSRLATAREVCVSAVTKWRSREPSSLAPSELLLGARELFEATADYYTVAQSGPIPAAMMSETTFCKFYDILVKRKGDPDAAKFVFGLDNHAMRAEKELYDLAVWAKDQPELAAYLSRTPADDMWAAMNSTPAPSAALAEFSFRFHAYLLQYGHAIYDLDFAKPTPADAPAPLLEAMKLYLIGKNSPYERQQAATSLWEQAAERITRRLDPLRRKYFLKLLHAAQNTGPLREDSIADLGLAHPQIRCLLGELGRRLAAAGAITSTEDVYWLELQELDALAARLEQGKAVDNYAADVERRKARWHAMRSVVPPTTLPKVNWMKMFFPSNEGTSPVIKGFAASAGRVTARACVMLGPEDFGRMQPGDVIVAGITTPAWTPLFARAAAIVTDIGGPLSHSSIVAREYGIPAVLATGSGTRRIRDGQMITVDGSAGTVTTVVA